MIEWHRRRHRHARLAAHAARFSPLRPEQLRLVINRRRPRVDVGAEARLARVLELLGDQRDDLAPERVLRQLQVLAERDREQVGRHVRVAQVPGEDVAQLELAVLDVEPDRDQRLLVVGERDELVLGQLGHPRRPALALALLLLADPLGWPADPEFSARLGARHVACESVRSERRRRTDPVRLENAIARATRNLSLCDQRRAASQSRTLANSRSACRSRA